MNKLVKLVLGLIGIIDLIAAIWFVALIYPIKYVSDFFISLPMKEDYMQIIGLIFAGVLILTAITICFWVLLSARSRQDVEFKTAKGQLVLSKNAIEKTITNSIKENYNLEDVTTNVKLLKKKSKANIKATTLTDVNLVEYGKDIEQFTSSKLTELLGIPVKKVIINLSTEKSKNSTKNSRVI